MPLLGSVAVTTVATATGRLTGTVAVTTGAVSTVTGTDGLTGDVAARGLSGWVGVRIASSVTGRVVVSTAGAATTAVGEATADASAPLALATAADLLKHTLLVTLIAVYMLVLYTLVVAIAILPFANQHDMEPAHEGGQAAPSHWHQSQSAPVVPDVPTYCQSRRYGYHHRFPLSLAGWHRSSVHLRPTADLPGSF